MNDKEPNKKKFVPVKIDESLDKPRYQAFFQQKLDKANETLRRVGLPKSMYNGNDPDRHCY